MVKILFLVLVYTQTFSQETNYTFTNYYCENKLPDSVFSLPEIKELRIINNNGRDILLDGEIRNCGFKTLSTKISLLKNLNFFASFNNDFCELPLVLSKIQNLNLISFDNNSCDINLSNMSSFIQVKKMYFDESSLYNVPDDINNLTELEYLSLRNTEIDSVDLQKLYDQLPNCEINYRKPGSLD
ncbi:leucine-rich repeat domain-containing protein [Flammeovirga aprica]|uniref:Leucine-rich repeat domain-containing protein n=1 Tax=Flammeovirga aprica JL-4 TaxID=694437 RepID=A0A7X9S006_9BACT|nr:leucine-rich repeat domain-containing protein [Flammeovirga aprica]NME71895.1 leucine-rich repeat domain-containing protein [Flammeovirga aprica JL-4]